MQNCQQSFDGVKEALCNAPVLNLPDWSKPFEVICDACDVGIGAVLLQEGRTIAFERKALTEAEQKYHIGEKELLAVVHALELWRCYLQDPEFTVVTDHSPNTFFETKKSLSLRQARWAEKLSKYKFMWEYRPGRLNVADPLSRLRMASAQVVCCDLGLAGTANATNAEVDIVADIMSGYASDAWFADEQNTATLNLKDGLYFKNGAVVVPDVEAIKLQTLEGLHNATYAGHVGTHITVKNVQRLYWWPAMRADIAKYVKGCQDCQRNTDLQRQPAGKLVPLPLPKGAWDVVTSDRITHLPETKSGYTAIWVAVDKLTQTAHFAPYRDDDDAEAIVDLFVKHVYRPHGRPLQFVTDRGREYCNKFAAAVCKAVGTVHSKSTAYHPPTNGQSERLNRVWKTCLGTM